MAKKELIEKKKGRPGRPKRTVDSPLTRKQELFVKILVSQDGMITKREAAIQAGFSVKSAHVKASEMLNPKKFPNIAAELKRYRDELDEKYAVNYHRHIASLQRIRDLALENQNFSAAVQAEYRRGQANGNIYINKSEIRHGSIDTMTKSEVLAALEELKAKENGRIIEVVKNDDSEEDDS